MYKLMPGEWYILFSCENCKTRQLLFPDLTEGKADLSLCNYGLRRRYCAIMPIMTMVRLNGTSTLPKVRQPLPTDDGTLNKRRF